MKRSAFLLVVGLVFSSTSLAQPSAGQFVIGGSSSFNFYKAPTSVSNNYNTSFGIMPRFGKFISDDLLLDGGIGYSYYHYRTNSSGVLYRSTDHNITGVAEITKFISVADKFYITLGGFINAGFGPSKTITEIAGVAVETSTQTVSAGLGASPGLAMFINEKWMLYTKVGALGYNMVYFESSGEMSHSFGYNFATNPFSLGVRYLF